MKFKYTTYILLFFFCGTAWLFADVTRSQKELQSLQSEIDRYEGQLSKKKKDEQGAANLIANLDRKIDLTSSVLYELQGQIRRNDHDINRLEQDIQHLQTQIDALRMVIKKRLVSFYKYGRRRDYNLLLTGGSLQTMDVWLRYERLVAQNDNRNFKSLISKRQKLQDDQQQLQVVMAQREKALAESKRQAGQLQQSRTKRRTYLRGVRQDRLYLEKHLEELDAAQAEIKGLISKSERSRVEKQRQLSNQNIIRKPSRDYSFASMKGRLAWPTTGPVVSHFGRQRHPTLKTVTENLGIEIRASLGAPVYAVDAGHVETITWQRGRGNIIILSHDDGYYTVYTHLEEIRVNVMDEIDAGQIIGTVGDSGSLNGPVLHFQIWKNTENLDPEKWLG